MLQAILGLIPALLLGLVFFIINPLLGVLWALWLVGVTTYTLKRKK